MKIGMVGLGRMGGDMTRRLIKNGHQVVVSDLHRTAVETLEKEGAIGSNSLEDLVSKLEGPKAVWIMVPAGDPTENTIQQLAKLLNQGDTILDGGNSNYKVSIRHASELEKRGIHFIDVGTSGGIWGRREGYSLMIGGKPEAVKTMAPVFKALAPAPEKGWGHVGPSGAGHFTKMIHNGIEYGMMQAYAEGFEILKEKKEFALDLHQVSEIWQHGSVVRSWLLDLTAKALQENPDLKGIKGWVSDSGEGRWAVNEAIELAVPATTIAHALFARFVSRREDSFAARVLAAMRAQFGGHAIKQEK